MLKQDFIPVAIDQWYQRRQQDAEGDFYRKIASQGPRNDFQNTTQGRYIATPDGTLLGFNNNRGTERVRKMMLDALEKFQSLSKETEPIVRGRFDDKYHFPAPQDGLRLRVTSRVLDGYPPPEPDDQWTAMFQQAMGRDNVWFRAEEKQQIINWIRSGGQLPDALALRIAKFHLVDNTRGEPDRWTPQQVRNIKLEIDEAGTMRGEFELRREGQHPMGYVGELFGVAAADSNDVTRFDLVARGQYWGEGRYTGGAPSGKFPVAIAFRIADGSDPADAIVPFGGKGWMAGYYE